MKCSEVTDEIYNAWLAGLCNASDFIPETKASCEEWLKYMSPTLDWLEHNKELGKILLNLMFEGGLFYGGFFSTPVFDPLNFAINCNDTFHYASADCEPIKSLEDIKLLGTLYDTFGFDGLDALAACRRDYLPLPQIAEKEDFRDALEYLKGRGYTITNQEEN